MYTCIYTHTYIYTHIYIYIYVTPKPQIPACPHHSPPPPFFAKLLNENRAPVNALALTVHEQGVK